MGHLRHKAAQLAAAQGHGLEEAAGIAGRGFRGGGAGAVAAAADRSVVVGEVLVVAGHLIEQVVVGLQRGQVRGQQHALGRRLKRCETSAGVVGGEAAPLLAHQRRVGGIHQHLAHLQHRLAQSVGVSNRLVAVRAGFGGSVPPAVEARAAARAGEVVVGGAADAAGAGGAARSLLVVAAHPVLAVVGEVIPGVGCQLGVADRVAVQPGRRQPPLAVVIEHIGQQRAAPAVGAVAEGAALQHAARPIAHHHLPQIPRPADHRSRHAGGGGVVAQLRAAQQRAIGSLHPDFAEAAAGSGGGTGVGEALHLIGRGAAGLEAPAHRDAAVGVEGGLHPVARRVALPQVLAAAARRHRRAQPAEADRAAIGTLVMQLGAGAAAHQPQHIGRARADTAHIEAGIAGRTLEGAHIRAVERQRDRARAKNIALAQHQLGRGAVTPAVASHDPPGGGRCVVAPLQGRAHAGGGANVTAAGVDRERAEARCWAHLAAAIAAGAVVGRGVRRVVAGCGFRRRWTRTAQRGGGDGEAGVGGQYALISPIPRQPGDRGAAAGAARLRPVEELLLTDQGGTGVAPQGQRPAVGQEPGTGGEVALPAATPAWWSWLGGG